MSLGVLEAVQEEEVSIAELRRSLWHLKQKLKKQSKILLSWKNKFIEESHVVAKLKAEKHSHLQSIQSQLLIFEGNLKRSKSELESVIHHKDNTIRIQHNKICALSLALLKKQGANELKKILPNIKLPRTTEPGDHHNLRSGINYSAKDEETSLIFSSKCDFESLNDSDSAIMMEDNYDSLIALPAGKGEIKIMRSVSDALEMISRGVTCSLNNKISYPNQIKYSYGSLSSTSSCSSEESDNSPSSTMNKLRNELLRKEFSWKDTISSNTVPVPSSSIPVTHYSVIKISENEKEHESGMLNFSSCNESNNFELNRHQSFVDYSSSLSSLILSPNVSPPSLATNNSKCYYSDSSGDKKDIDSDATLSDGQSDDGDSGFGSRLPPLPPSERIHNKRTLFGSYEKLNNIHPSYVKHSPREELIQVTYNRVMSNHRSVTKPKDVKYKRINKAKSRSLEELRGKLKHFDGKQTISIDSEASNA